MRHHAKAEYILGHAPKEIDRLVFQASVIGPTTERLFKSAEIGAGMRLLDVGCGAGDVSMLAAKFVGPNGSVFGIDQNPQVIAVAKRRAREANLANVDFEAVSLDAFAATKSFDGVIGRYVLVHQSDPAGFLCKAASFLEPDGIIAFHEVDLASTFKSTPPVWRWDATGNLVVAAFREVLPHYDVGNRFVALFSDAGLPPPNLISEALIGGGENSPFYRWLAETMYSVLPQLAKMGIMIHEAMPAGILEDRLRAAAISARSQIEAPAQICAWARI
jgi:ubiquinone/menaquinone biosynthesis C-methylase UbiE